MTDLFREILQTLKHNKLRTALTGFAVAWGIFLLIVLLGLLRGIINSFESFQNPESLSMSVWGGWTSKAYHGYKEGRSISLKESDIKAISEENRTLTEGVRAGMSIDSAKVASLRDYVSRGIKGVYPEEYKIMNGRNLRGRFINESDMKNERKVIVLPTEYAVQLFGDAGDAVGQRVRSQGLSWLVVGVYDHNWRTDCLVPFTTAMSLFGKDGKIAELNVAPKGLMTEADGTAAEKAIRATLSRQHQFDPADEGALHIWNRFNNYMQQQTGNSILTVAVWVLGILTLLSGIVGVSNIMFVSVRERTHEIGIRRAIGARPRDILRQIVAESIAITTIFGYIGIVAGNGVLLLLDSMFGSSEFMKHPNVDLSVAVEVTIALIIAGAFAGLFPAIKATKVKPVEALRDE